MHLFEEFGYDFCDMLDGIFALVVIDGDDYIVARDPLGVKPLYYGMDERGRLYFASEMKAITDQCKSFSTFPPGHYYTEKTGFVKSNGEARRALTANSISVNKEKVAEDFVLSNKDLINSQFVLLQSGKKNYFVVRVV